MELKGEICRKSRGEIRERDYVKRSMVIRHRL